jgi:GT2 family glycosyltransferase
MSNSREAVGWQPATPLPSNGEAEPKQTAHPEAQLSIEAYEQRIRTLERQLRTEVEARKVLMASLSWRITAPLRRFSRQWTRIRQRLPGTASHRPAIASAPRSKAGGQILPKDAIERLARVQLDAFLANDAVLEIGGEATPDASIILVLYNRAALTWACLRSIRECQGEARLEIIIIDNSSTDDTYKLLQRLIGPRVLVNSSNLGFLHACNQAAREAKGRNLLFLNNDALLIPGSLKAALETLESSDTIGAVGARIILLDGSLQEAGSIIWRDGSCTGYGRGDRPDAPEYMFARDVDFCSGAFLLTPRDTFLATGGFDEAYAPAYYEEVDYCLRLATRRLRTVYDPRSVILHYEFASSASSDAAIALQKRNRETFVERWHAALRNRPAAEAKNVCIARTAATSAQRVLVIEDQVPHPELGRGYPRAHTLLLALYALGAQITLYPMCYTDESWNSVYRDLPREIEIMNGHGPSRLLPFLADRSGYFHTVFVSRPHNARIFREALSLVHSAFQDARLIYDAEAIFALREGKKAEMREGRPISESRLRDLVADEVALAGFADAVVAVSDAEAACFQAYGVRRPQVLVVPSESPATVSQLSTASTQLT